MKRDICAGSVLAIFSIILYTHSSGFVSSESAAVAMRPGFYPQLISLVLGILSLLLVADSVKQLVMQKTTASQPPFWKNLHSFGLFCVTVASLVLFPVLLIFVGFVPACFLFALVLITALSSRQQQRRQKILIIVITTAITVLVYLVFQLFLKIPFPRGALF